jgi:cytochrome P450
MFQICQNTFCRRLRIYSNKASKSHAYDTFKFRDVKMCIRLLDVKQAHARRKALLPAFSRQNLLEVEPVIRRHLEKFLKWLEKFNESNTPVETFQWFRYLTFDVVTDIAFGQQIGMLTTEDSHFTEQVELRNKRNGLVRSHLQKWDSRLTFSLQNGPFPFILPIMRFLGMKTAKQWDNADDEIAGVSKIPR